MYSLTGVQPENQKILIKGKQVKDETDMASLGLKPAQAIMVLGQPGAAPVRFEAPKERTRFVEDMDGMDPSRQDLLAAPSGLTNLGNTCYLNASLQTMRAIPELQDSLINRFEADSSSSNTTQLARQLRDVFSTMASSHAPYVPTRFLNTLRTFNPRFAERSRTGQGFAQQDAEEAWTFIMDNLRRTHLVKDKPKALPPALGEDEKASTATTVEDVPEEGAATSGSSVSIVKRYLAGEFQKTLVCDEPEGGADDASSAKAAVATTTETFLSLPCHISISINHLRDGLLAGLTEKIEKHSEALGRDATFTSTLKISRLPKYLTVHFVRFYWKRDIQKKAKIMRKVTFPHELDISEMCTDELRAKLVPVREKVREVRKDVEEIERTNKKRKRRLSEEKKAEKADKADKADAGGSSSGADKPKDEKEKKGGDGKADGGEADVEYKTDAQIDEEKRAALHKAQEELYQLVRPRLAEDRYANHTGLYELRAVVAHQGAGADSGHYTAFVKKGSLVDPKTGRKAADDGNWWWFNDDNVSEVGSDRIDQLAGGGEAHSALILLYGSVPLPLPESRVTEPFFTS